MMFYLSGLPNIWLLTTSLRGMDSTLPKCCCNYIHVKCIATSVQYPTLKHNFPAIQLENHKTWLVGGTQFWQYSTENHKMKDCLNKDGEKQPKKIATQIGIILAVGRTLLEEDSCQSTPFSALEYSWFSHRKIRKKRFNKHAATYNTFTRIPLHTKRQTLVQGKVSNKYSDRRNFTRSFYHHEGRNIVQKISTCRDDFWPGSAQLCNLW